MNEKIKLLEREIAGKRVGILGFGLEGRSTYTFLRKHFGNIQLIIADRDSKLAENISFAFDKRLDKVISGEEYLEKIPDLDILFKSPGVKLPDDFAEDHSETIITSQTELLMQWFRGQVIGITGTKGKSTTSSLVYHILQSAGRKSILIGNIGIPPLDLFDQITENTLVVYELSSHQLENLQLSPHIAVLLNLFPEHLDRYPSRESYYMAKWNIFLHQEKDDIFIHWDDIPGNDLPRAERIRSRRLSYGMNPPAGQGCQLVDGELRFYLDGQNIGPFRLPDDLYLKGRHNRLNIMAAALTCMSCGLGLDEILSGVSSFKGLEHRLEYVGNFRGIDFYNDSIATIPEATLEAVNTVSNIGSLILGGYDRGLDYRGLIEELMRGSIPCLVFMGRAGKRMYGIARETGAESQRLFCVEDLDEAFEVAAKMTPEGSACLLSPAAASYDHFKNFEERGNFFKKKARSL